MRQRWRAVVAYSRCGLRLPEKRESQWRSVGQPERSGREWHQKIQARRSFPIRLFSGTSRTRHCGCGPHWKKMRRFALFWIWIIIAKLHRILRQWCGRVLRVLLSVIVILLKINLSKYDWRNWVSVTALLFFIKSSRPSVDPSQSLKGPSRSAEVSYKDDDDDEEEDCDWLNGWLSDGQHMLSLLVKRNRSIFDSMTTVADLNHSCSPALQRSSFRCQQPLDPTLAPVLMLPDQAAVFDAANTYIQVVDVCWCIYIIQLYNWWRPNSVSSHSESFCERQKVIM